VIAASPYISGQVGCDQSTASNRVRLGGEEAVKMGDSLAQLRHNPDEDEAVESARA
jgi:hypothetical protein